MMIMKSYNLKFCRLMIVFLCVALVACATIKADNFRNRAFEIADWDNWSKNSEKALEYLLKTLEIKPDDVKALWAAGILYYLKEDYDQAESHLKRALVLDEKYGKAWNNVGWVYFKKKQYSEMRGAFQKAIEYRGSYEQEGWDYIGLGQANYNMQKYDLAENNFRKSLSMMNSGKSHRNARYWLGCIKYKKGEKKKISEIFKDYVDNHTEKHIAYKAVGRFLYFSI
jgi:tetratricopeptide (TPR) repeat protein